MEACDLLLGGSYLLTMDGADTRIRNGAVAVRGGKSWRLDPLSS